MSDDEFIAQDMVAISERIDMLMKRHKGEYKIRRRLGKMRDLLSQIIFVKKHEREPPRDMDIDLVRKRDWLQAVILGEHVYVAWKEGEHHYYEGVVMEVFIEDNEVYVCFDDGMASPVPNKAEIVVIKRRYTLKDYMYAWRPRRRVNGDTSNE